MTKVTISRILKLQSIPMRGNDVKYLQQYLNILGATPPLKEDGVFGQRTADAVLSFQLSFGEKFNKDGIVTPSLFRFIAEEVKLRSLAEQEKIISSIGKQTAFQSIPQQLESRVYQDYIEPVGLKGSGWLLILLAGIGYMYFKKKNEVVRV